jgi:hypothetical protein
MTEHEQPPKLPQARLYLRAAKWGFDDMLAKQLTDTASIFYLVGILASLRAVQHALWEADRTLSEEHKRVINEWWQATPLSTPELHFIKTSRDLLLKAGAFRAFAIYTESSTGEDSNVHITATDYELVYYDEADQRKDLKAAIRGAIRWCDQELTSIEAKLPEL